MSVKSIAIVTGGGGYLVAPAAKWMTGASMRIDGSEIKVMQGEEIRK
jgi:hypothetical protein